jgi:superfamily I DNA and/or RNA helicase/very-short-patch-repair endonuclease
MTDLIFLKALRDKLKGGNIRSIHLNALPGRYATRLDFANLNYIRSDFAEQFLTQLLTQSCFDFKISFDGIDLNAIQQDEQKRLGLLSKRLNSINIENEDNYKEHGIKTFGFGFPILIKPSKQDPKKIIKAPLFIWQLEIIKSTNKVNTWSILRNKTRNDNGKIVDEEVHSVALNEVLLSFLKTDENILVPQINEELLEDAVIDQKELIDECYKVLKALNTNTTTNIKESLEAKFKEPLNNIPDAGNLESVSGNTPWIHFGGVFGLFRAQKESIITDIDKIIDRFDDFDFESLVVENFSGTPHSAIETDPSQQEILTTLGIEPNKIIQGPPGTGKSQSLTALITNALANNLKCLVVCEKKTALDVIKNNLHKENDQLGALAAVVEDINKDRDAVVNSVRDRLGNLFQYGNYPKSFYTNNLQLVETKAQELNLQHKELDKKLYKGKTWTQLIGEFLKKQRLADFSELKSKLDFKQFKFQNDENELPEIVNKIKVANKLYQEINRLDHPLEILHDEIFRQDIPRALQLRLEEIEKESSAKLQTIKTNLRNDVADYEIWLDGFYKSAIERTEELNELFNSDINLYAVWLDSFYKQVIDKINKLIELLNSNVSEYENWLDTHYGSYYRELKLKISDYLLFGSSNYDRFGELFYKNNGFTKLKINVFSILSKKFKDLKTNRFLLIEKISEIKEAHLNLNYFEHIYPEENHYKTLKVYIDNINDINVSADKWYETYKLIKKDYVNKLSSNFLHPQYKNSTLKIVAAENVYHEFLQYISKDTKLEIELQSVANHLSKIEELKLLSLQFEGLEEIKRYYLEKLSSDFLHPQYKSEVLNFVNNENFFQEFISHIAKDKRIITSINRIESHLSTIEELKLLSRQLKEWQKIKSYYIDKLSSNEIHPHYSKNTSILQTTESQFEKMISFLNTEQIFKRNSPISVNHFQKISETVFLISEMQKISQNLNDFREYFEWRKFYIHLSSLYQTVVKSLIEINCKNWETTFESWYYFWLLAKVESDLKYLPKDNNDIVEFTEAKKELKINQVRSIISNWSNKQQQSVKSSNSNGLNPISLFNKRGSRGERRNSLRKIIKTDFRMFTDFFPVVMLSPTVCSSIIPLVEGVFDIVIFDEASQLRLEDTYPALLRGKIKVVSGDSQQMPPSNFFQGGTALLSPTEEDYEEEQTTSEIQTSNRNANNSLDLADSESLLVYAENCNYKQSYLKVHYRSHHPYLIDFSNHAFYGKRLIPMPAKQEYTPIQFIEVNGLYEDQVNRDEARQVVDILLNHIKPFKNGKYPSVGVATFNLYQRNLILEEIIKVRQQKPEYDKRIVDLGSDLFVKNLENIQGDERDIIIISTTFGKKADGNFRQHFGPIVQGKGYKLLNVIITRAKYKVFICTSIPQQHINQYSSLLQESKNTGRAVFYAYLAYAKAVSDRNYEIRESILKQLYENCESRSFDVEDVFGSESPFEEEVYYRLAEKIGQERLQQQYRIGGFRIDLIVKSKVTGKPIIAIECDGAKYHSSNEAYAWDIFRQSRLEEQGFVFYRIWSTNWWYSAEKEVRKLVEFVFQFDGNETKEEVIPLDDVLKVDEIIPITLRSETKKKVSYSSFVTVKNPEGKILKVRFSKTQASQNVKPDEQGLITVYDRSPLALAIMGRTEGETCQLGMLELYYEILSVE